MMLKAVEKAINEHEMLRHGRRLLVALSGGADSVALLRALHALAPSLGLSISAAHLNHGLRGPSAKRDEAFCEALCKELGLPFLLRRVDVAQLSRQYGESLEMAGRRARYDYFSLLISQGKADAVATAHTADDNVETMLLRLVRGSSLEGLSGIATVHGRGGGGPAAATTPRHK